MVCIIHMGRVGSRMATPMLAKHSEPAETWAELLNGWILCHPLLFASTRVSPALTRMYGSFSSVSSGVPSTLWKTDTKHEVSLDHAARGGGRRGCGVGPRVELEPRTHPGRNL